MKSVAPGFLVILACIGCGSRDPASPKNANPQVPTAPRQSAAGPFLDQKKQIGPRLDWNREITTKRGGTISFRVSSQGPFSVTVVMDKVYQALQRRDEETIKKEGVILTLDAKESPLEKTVLVPAGSSWFIITNQTDEMVEMHLQCYDAPAAIERPKEGKRPKHTPEGAENSAGPNPKLPTWKPKEESLAQLEEETDVPGYPMFRIRPPRGYQLQKQERNGRQLFLWNGPKRDDGTWSQLSLTIIQDPPELVKTETLDQNFRNFLAGVKNSQIRFFPKWNSMLPEKGLVNGLTFIRASFSATSADEKKKLHGFISVTMDGSTGLAILSEDIEPYDKETLELTEASALTIRKK